jgi:hypothetical protein
MNIQVHQLPQLQNSTGQEAALVAFRYRVNPSLAKISLEMDADSNAIAESKRVTKLLWKHTVQLPEFRSECEERFKSFAERMKEESLEKEAEELNDAAKREYGKMMALFWKTVLENYKD